MNSPRKTIAIPFGADASTQNPLEVYANCATAYEFAREIERLGHVAKVIPLLKDGSVSAACAGADGVVNLCDGDPGSCYAMADAAAALESLGVPFTGEGASVFIANHNKKEVRSRLQAAGINPPDRPGFPLFAKPLSAHGSLYITTANIIRNEEELRAFDSGGVEMYFEPYLDGPEFSVSIWRETPIGVSRLRFSARCPIVTRDRKWDFSSAEALEHEPAEHFVGADMERFASVRDVAVAAAKLIGCRSAVRVDVRCDGDKPHVIDINPNPYLGYDGLYAKVFEANGVGYHEFLRLMMLPVLDCGAGLASRFAEPVSIEIKKRPDWCGVASLQAALAFLGSELTQEDISAHLPKLPTPGFDPEHLVRAASALGFKATYCTPCNLDDLRRLLAEGWAVVVSYQSGGGGHYSVAAAVSNADLRLLDPDTGATRLIPCEEFVSNWFERYSTGTCAGEVVAVSLPHRRTVGSPSERLGRD